MNRRYAIKQGGLVAISLALPLPIISFTKNNEMNITKKNEISETEVIIVGAGPSGLAAALFLARANRKVIIFNWGKKRMPEKAKIHEYLGFDNMNPNDYFLKTKKEVESFGGIFIEEKVMRIQKKENDTFTTFSENSEINSTALILATGAVDILPNIPGLKDGWGIDIHVCPCFTGYELNNKKLTLFGTQARLAHLSIFLTSWSNDITVIANEPFSGKEIAQLKQANIKVHIDKITEIIRSKGEIKYVSTKSGKEIESDGIFIATPIKAKSSLVKDLCEVDQNGFAITDKFYQSSTKGLWVIGNAHDPKGHMAQASSDGTQVGPFVANYLIHSKLEKQ
ncbi:NAD(P)/FAD-dependent oxidoreductase [Pontimicrobium sp. SW4]|uniref:NAD(P)/FAD-dependent oxidoreductase n=1 Tax=Pontimicrobium sp. SW4 TaxID=3153519 RepID=A0AAU7BQ70_9FLAO